VREEREREHCRSTVFLRRTKREIEKKREWIWHWHWCVYVRWHIHCFLCVRYSFASTTIILNHRICNAYTTNRNILKSGRTSIFYDWSRFSFSTTKKRTEKLQLNKNTSIRFYRFIRYLISLSIIHLMTSVLNSFRRRYVLFLHRFLPRIYN